MKTNKCYIMEHGFEYKGGWGRGVQLYYNSKTNEYASVNSLDGEAEIFKSEEE